jgi:hypothetical protein
MGVSSRAVSKIEWNIRGDGQEKFKRILSLIVVNIIIFL